MNESSSRVVASQHKEAREKVCQRAADMRRNFGKRHVRESEKEKAPYGTDEISMFTEKTCKLVVADTGKKI